jgi:hypothetical protein
VLLALAIIGGATPDQTILALIYFTVGALIGIFPLVRTALTADTAVDDFGLSTARAIHTPLFSGLAAVIGVVLVSVGTAVDKSAIFIDVFDSLKLTYLVSAAVFGLVPDLIIQRLTQQADKYREDLKSIQSTSKKPAQTS